MKFKFVFLSLLLLAQFVAAQVPQGIPYQAAARGANGQPLVNTNVKVRFSIIDSISTGAIVYQETHTAATNNIGLFSLNVGLGTPGIGIFANINWGKNFKFMKVELDPTGAGSNYLDMGTQQLMSVPYSIYARIAGEARSSNYADSASYASNGIPSGTNSGDILYWNGNTWVRLAAGTDGQVLTMSGGIPMWANSGSVASFLPSLNTNSISTISNIAAISGATITSTGSSSIIAKGVCWSTMSGPTISLNTKTNDGSGMSNFTSTLTNLLGGTTYYVRAYASNGAGTAYGPEISFTTMAASIATIQTRSVSSITASTVSCGGIVVNNGGAILLASGVCWSTSPNPTLNSSNKTNDSINAGPFTSSLKNLSPSTKYYIRAYALNALGVAYGNLDSFTTLSGLALLSTTTSSSVTITTANSGGNITSANGSSIIASGVCWSTNSNPTIALNTKTNNGTILGTYYSILTALSPSTKYYVRAYATTNYGTAYGQLDSFTTLSGLPSITTSAISGVTFSRAQCGGTILSTNGASGFSLGVCWSNISIPTIAVDTTNDHLGNGSFISNIAGLSSSTKYYVRAYVTTIYGTSYGQLDSFTTATLTTMAPSSITANTAQCGGTIASANGLYVNSSGVCWSTKTNPTVSTNASNGSGAGTGTYSSSITGLNPSTKYYVKAYATINSETTYGQLDSFITLSGLATLSTTTSSSITTTSASSGGNITTANGSTVSARGVCWSTTPNPTILLSSKINNGSGTGNYSSSITGLSAATKYYVRAYATTGYGTSYGAQDSFITLSGLATLSTTTSSSITTTSASSGGNITTANGSTVSARGVCWSTARNPTIALTTKTSDGTGIGSFSSSITVLSAATKYYVRAYATTGYGTSYGAQDSFTTLGSVALLTTTVSSSITTTTASSGGNISTANGSTVSARGVCWSTARNPTIALTTKTSDGTGIGSFSSSITGLSTATKYYVRAYATTSYGTGYGAQDSFTTLNGLATLSTITSSFVSTSTASSAGNITSANGSTVTARGVCWSTARNPTIALTTKTSDGTGIGTFSSSITGLSAATKYYVRAYATTGYGTSYGAQDSFITLSGLATLSTTTSSSITTTSASSGGNISTANGSTVSARGVCWSTARNPTIALTTKTSDGTGIGSFSSSITVLSAATKYYVRAYATTGYGTSYGAQDSFTTLGSVALLTTTVSSSITTTTASSGGNISTANGSTVSARGVCWSTARNPTIALTTKTSDGTGIGTFSSSITGLSTATKYYVRAYATTSYGTGYGAQDSFTTLSGLATLSTATSSSITTTSASSGGNISTANGSTVSARGVCWSTVRNPTIALTTKTSDGTGIGSFNSNITGLILATKYYVRAYATTSFGTNYGAQDSFTTLNGLASVTTDAASGITNTFATSGGNVLNNGGLSGGGGAVTENGICWSTSPNPTIGLLTKISQGGGLGAFSASITGLLPGTTYYVRAYAVTINGTSYGNQDTFSTLNVNATLTLSSISNITSTSANCSVQNLSTNGPSITTKGVCWSTSPNPSIALSTKTSNGTGTGTFSGSPTGLTAGTTYFVRAYATTSAGTSYSSQDTFTTAPAAIGANYGGGILSYYYQPGVVGYSKTVMHGLIISSTDITSGLGAQWGCSGTTINSTSNIIGTGNINTNSILAICNTSGIAAQLCDAYVSGVYTDWYLPNKKEALIICNNISGIDNFWTSFEDSSTMATIVNSISGGNASSSSVAKSGGYLVRAVRSF